MYKTESGENRLHIDSMTPCLILTFPTQQRSRTRIMIRMYICIYFCLHIYIYICLYTHILLMPIPRSIVWLPLQNHASVRAAHNMRSWRLYWHYLTLTCRISQLSQGDRWSLPEGQGDAMTYDDLLIFLLVTLLSWKYTRCWNWHLIACQYFLKITFKKITLSRFHPSYPLPFLEIEDISKISKKTNS